MLMITMAIQMETEIVEHLQEIIMVGPVDTQLMLLFLCPHGRTLSGFVQKLVYTCAPMVEYCQDSCRNWSIPVVYREGNPPLVVYNEGNPPLVVYREGNPPLVVYREDNPPLVVYREDNAPLVVYREGNPPLVVYREGNPVV